VWIFLLYTLSKVGIFCFNALSPGLVWTPILSEASKRIKGRSFRLVKSFLHFILMVNRKTAKSIKPINLVKNLSCGSKIISPQVNGVT